MNQFPFEQLTAIRLFVVIFQSMILSVRIFNDRPSASEFFAIFLAFGFSAVRIWWVIFFALWLFTCFFLCKFFAVRILATGFFLWNITAWFSNDKISGVRLFALGFSDVELFINLTFYLKLSAARHFIAVLMSVTFFDVGTFRCIFSLLLIFLW